MLYEIVQQHELQDIYRVCGGVLVIVNKYKNVSYHLHHFTPKGHKKISGIKNCYKLSKDFTVDEFWKNRQITFPKGSLILEGCVIEIIPDSKDYFYELKTTGNSFSGDLAEFDKLMGIVNEIMNLYRGQI